MQKKLNRINDLLNSGDLYAGVDDELITYQHELVERLNQFNSTPDTPEGLKKREEILREALGTYGDGLYIIPPIYANWGLKNVHVGKNVIFNFNVCLVDDADIFIGDDCLIGPGCHIITAQHPISPMLRKGEDKLQYNKPIHLGNNVWLGAGVIVLPGVTIGDNSIVAAGSVVTHSVGSNVIVAGTPAKVLRQITEKDNQICDGKKPIPEEIIEKYMK